MSLVKLSRLASILTALVLATLLIAAACGGDDDGGDGNGGNGDDGNGNGGELTFDVSMGDNFFEPSDFTVAAGSTVTFSLSNDGTAIHNMRVDGGDGEYNTDDDTVSDPELMNAGDTGTLVWIAPSEAGEIIFQCDFHPTDMVGTITVE